MLKFIKKNWVIVLLSYGPFIYSTISLVQTPSMTSSSGVPSDEAIVWISIILFLLNIFNCVVILKLWHRVEYKDCFKDSPLVFFIFYSVVMIAIVSSVHLVLYSVGIEHLKLSYALHNNQFIFNNVLFFGLSNAIPLSGLLLYRFMWS